MEISSKDTALVNSTILKGSHNSRLEEMESVFVFKIQHSGIQCDTPQFEFTSQWGRQFKSTEKTFC